MKRVLISSSGVPMMPVKFSPVHAVAVFHREHKKHSEAASIHFEPFRKNTIPAGSQSPTVATSILKTVFMQAAHNRGAAFSVNRRVHGTYATFGALCPKGQPST